MLEFFPDENHTAYAITAVGSVIWHMILVDNDIIVMDLGEELYRYTCLRIASNIVSHHYSPESQNPWYASEKKSEFFLGLKKWKTVMWVDLKSRYTKKSKH